MPVHRDLPWQTVKSLVETQDVLRAKNIQLVIQMQVGSSIIEAARSKSVHEFLQGSCSRLFWVDSDIAWNPEDFLKLALYSTKMDVVCGAYCSKKDEPNFMIAGFASDTSNEYGCLEVLGLGLGFTCVHRKIMEELAAKSRRLKFPDVDVPVAHIFHCDTTGEEFRGEDIAFFNDVRSLGYKVWLDPTVQLKHIGNKAYSADFMAGLQTTPVQ